MQSVAFHHFTPRPTTDLLMYFREKGSSVLIAGCCDRSDCPVSGDGNELSRVRDISCSRDLPGNRRAVALTSPPGSVPCCSVCPVTVKKERSRRCPMNSLKNRIPKKTPKRER